MRRARLFLATALLLSAADMEVVGEAANRILAALDRERFPRPFAAAGFSLGGNLVLRYLGEDPPAVPPAVQSSKLRRADGMPVFSMPASALDNEV